VLSHVNREMVPCCFEMRRCRVGWSRMWLVGCVASPPSNERRGSHRLSATTAHFPTFFFGLPSTDAHSRSGSKQLQHSGRQNFAGLIFRPMLADKLHRDASLELVSSPDTTFFTCHIFI
jgi:hypothetical protein